MSRRNPKKRKKFNPIKTFFKIVLSMVLVFVILAGGACFAYHKVTGKGPFAGNGVITNAGDMSILDALLGKNIKLNVAVFGVDKDGTRTDVAFVAHYDSEQESINLISVPESSCSA